MYSNHHVLVLHVRVGDAVQGHEGLLDRLRAGPLEHVVRAPGLVVSSGQTGASEGLLAHHGPGGLVIDVKVTGSPLQENGSFVSKLSREKFKLRSSSLLLLWANLLVMTIESSSECIGGVVSNGLQSGHAVLVLVDIDADQGTKDLLPEDLVLGGGDLHDGRLHEVSHTVVIAASGHDAAVGAGLCMFNVTGEPLEGLLVNHGGHEGVGLRGWANLQGLLGLNEPLLDLGPQGLWHVDSGAGGALLSLVLEGRSDG